MKKKKMHLIKEFCHDVHCSQQNAHVFFHFLFKNIVNILLMDGKLTIFNLGSFRLHYKKDRIGRNPKTGQEYLIWAHKTLTFCFKVGLGYAVPLEEAHLLHNKN